VDLSVALRPFSRAGPVEHCDIAGRSFYDSKTLRLAVVMMALVPSSVRMTTAARGGNPARAGDPMMRAPSRVAACTRATR
jgi:hypothetical protein